MSLPRLKPYPSNGAITIADGDIYEIASGGDFIRVKSADQEFTLRLDDNHDIKGVSVNDKFRLTEGDKFKKLTVINNSGNPLTFQLVIGEGDASNDGTSISGIVKTDDDATQALLTTMDAVLDAIKTDTANIANIEALLKNDELLRSPVVVLGASLVGASNTSAVQTLITPATNTNGIIIRTIEIAANGSTTNSLFADTAAPAGATDITKKMIATARDARFDNIKTPLYLPAGIGLYSAATSASGAGTFVNVTYDLLP